MTVDVSIDVVYDPKYPYWDQVSLNNAKSQTQTLVSAQFLLFIFSRFIMVYFNKTAAVCNLAMMI